MKTAFSGISWAGGRNRCGAGPMFDVAGGRLLPAQPALVQFRNERLGAADDARVVGVTQDYINIQRQLVDGGFDPLIYQTAYADYPASWSLCIGDLDGNGYNDLLYGGGYGVTFMMAADGGEAFVERSGPEYVFSQRSNMVDINNDGHLDAFVCHDVAPNVYYMNDGNGNLQFTQGGLGYSCGNYGSIWTDYDNDGDMDCFVAKCGCDPVDLLMRNEGNGSFSQLGPALGFADGHQSWSSAWGDLDNDGDMDAVIGSSSSGYPQADAQQRRWHLHQRHGRLRLGRLLPQGIEWVTHDFNNDGLLDILGAGSLLINRGGLTFSANTFSPGPGAVGDVNNDGALDVMGQYGLQVNQGNGNNWLRLDLRGTVSNRNGIGARITLTTAHGHADPGDPCRGRVQVHEQPDGPFRPRSGGGGHGPHHPLALRHHSGGGRGGGQYRHDRYRTLAHRCWPIDGRTRSARASRSGRG